jgi:hypothetical protein
MNAGPPSGVGGKWVLLGLVVVVAIVSTAIVLISRDLDARARKARELESKLGREVGPLESPKYQKKISERKAAQ